MELSKKVKALRKKQGLSQLELAEKIFVSRQAISGWEAGTSRPSTENLQCLSKLYAVPLEVLLDDKQELEFGGDKQSEPVIPQKQRKKKCVSMNPLRRRPSSLRGRVCPFRSLLCRRIARNFPARPTTFRMKMLCSPSTPAPGALLLRM